MATKKSAHEKQVNDFLAKMKAILMAPNHGDAEWPDISTDERVDMQNLFVEAMELKWGQDCDGDRPVTLSMWNRKTHRLPWDIPMRHTPERKSRDEREAVLLDNLQTVTCALSAYGDELRKIQFSLAEMRHQRLAEQAAVPVILVKYNPPKSWETSEAKYDQAASIHLTQEEADAFKPPKGFTKVRSEQRWAVPAMGESAADNFKAYKAKVKASCGKVSPQYGMLEKLNLKLNQPGQPQ